LKELLSNLIWVLEYEFSRLEMCWEFYSKPLAGIDHLGDIDIDEKVILKWIIKKEDAV
jgi:hypothetical protein